MHPPAVFFALLHSPCEMKKTQINDFFFNEMVEREREREKERKKERKKERIWMLWYNQ
jgi:hypothetical protein